MTREEAIEVLKKNRPGADPRRCGLELCTAVDVAIAALREQETVTKCNDLYDEDGGEILNRTESDTVKPVEIDQFKTNADHIRSMTDEELATFLSEVEYRRSIAGGGAIWLDSEGAMVWLKQPYKEDT